MDNMMARHTISPRVCTATDYEPLHRVLYSSSPSLHGEQRTRGVTPSVSTGPIPHAWLYIPIRPPPSIAPFAACACACASSCVFACECMCVCVRACVRACKRACLRICVCSCALTAFDV